MENSLGVSFMKVIKVINIDTDDSKTGIFA